MIYVEIVRILLEWVGVYCVLMHVWQYFEKMELGYVVTTVTDSVICIVISAIIAFVLSIIDD